MINGTEYYRRRAGLTPTALARRAGISIYTLNKMLWDDHLESMMAITFFKVSNALEIPIDLLLRKYEEEQEPYEAVAGRDCA